MIPALVVAAASGGSVAAHAPPPAAARNPPAKIIFPVVGPAQFSDDFGAPRAQGGHQANDVLAAWRAPLVAVEDGTVKVWTRSATAGCMLYLYGRSGTTYQYVHLNNDVTPRNDNSGGCVPGVAYAPGLVDGQRVRAGALLGFVGDSGDAAGKHPHVHFELHPRDGGAVSPYRWLLGARRLLYATAEPGGVTLTLSGTVRAVATGAAGSPQLTVAVRNVRLSSGDTFASDQTVVLAVPASAAVQHRAVPAPRPATPDEAVPGEPVSATVKLEASTLRTQLAAPGALVAAGLVLRGTP